MNNSIKTLDIKYDNQIVKLFTLATLFWLIVGLAAGVYVALELAYPSLNFGIPWLNFGRLRQVHTTGVLFAFVGNVLFATSLFIVQRTCQARLVGKKLAYIMFAGYQFFIIIALYGYCVGITQSREYAEPEWYADLLLLFVWLIYLYVYIGTVVKRKEPHIYVANWFFMAYIIVVAMLHIGNNLSIPLSLFGSESVYLFSGVQSAMIQWWYGHSMVGFLLTTGIIGMVYYFIPKRAGRPIYSYRLSIMHFWALIFLYIWAGAHHLHFTALPDWAQTLGMAMSIILWLPSWGGMVNSMMTLSGAWYKLKEDPVLRFFVIALAFYGMSTFEGPLMAIKTVNALSHYTEWTIGHVHSGTLGWVGLISFGALYCLIPVLWNREEMYSVKLMSLHLWLACIGIILYITSMWVAGITQGLMWRSYDEMGFLKYSFIEVVSVLHPYYVIRALGGIFYLLGTVIMVYNAWMTITSKQRQEKLTPATI
ncbi:cytochrome c oxidase, cbb3-type subunit I [endosymbiont of Acanthamoeba sp. UWC8]|uniref:cytochrome-c oxidase, cbb3-type subunit I n=1 Tax=endosymbiont of Acanthamoeba sp. UWC8 TaxID=86106 RepID=UPI0004D1745F|nr:cytochrome-c oxidase, cbb3-type subunit I [endosymbiont of Acanthamoeba sp. UWC8]AIF81773.1 cytochrome c oxidase, cbb3-type subunit I [endosymbiont of Acanthamoeba sp. UWC8]